MALFDKEFNEYRAKNESFEKTWMASNLNDVAKWALIFGVLSLVPQVVYFVNKIYDIFKSNTHNFGSNWKFELLGFVLNVLSIITSFILISFAIKFKNAFKKGDETDCIRLIVLLKTFFICTTFTVIFGFCAQQILHFFYKYYFFS
jgi:hypothetical protein